MEEKIFNEFASLGELFREAGKKAQSKSLTRAEFLEVLAQGAEKLCNIMDYTRESEKE